MRSSLARNAKRLLDDIVSRGRGTPPSSYHESTNGQNGSVHEMMIPAGKAGLVIGKGGETIKQLQVHCMVVAFALFRNCDYLSGCVPTFAECNIFYISKARKKIQRGQ